MLLSPPATTSSGDETFGGRRCLSFGIGPIKIPEYLNQPKIVTRKGPNELTLAEFDRWAERLKDNLTRVLAKNLSNLLCTKDDRSLPMARGDPHRLSDRNGSASPGR